MSQETLSDLLMDEIKDLYSAETQLAKALPKLAKAATDESLKEAFEEHLEQTKEHAQRLERVAELLGGTPRGKTCKAMRGLVEEGEEMIGEEGEDVVKDAALIAAAQKVEHYEIASYGTARTLAEVLGNDDAAELLETTLAEEKSTDVKLSELADTINERALATAEPEEAE